MRVPTQGTNSRKILILQTQIAKKCSFVKFVLRLDARLYNFCTQKSCVLRTPIYHMIRFWLVISVYSSSLSVAHLSDAPRRRLVVTRNSARIQNETNEGSVWFFNVLGVQHRHTGPRFKSLIRKTTINC